jgi:cytochrome c556
MGEEVTVEPTAAVDAPASGSPAEGATPPEGEGESKFVSALKEKGLDNWADTVTRWDKERAESKEATTAAQAKIAELEERLNAATSSAETAKATEALVKQGIKQGFTRSQLVDYLDRHTAEELAETLERDANKGGDDKPEKSPVVDKLQKRVDQLEKKLSKQSEDQSIGEQLFTTLDEVAKDEPEAIRQLITKAVLQDVELARARHQKLPNIAEAVKNAAQNFATLTKGAIEEYVKANGKGSGSALAAQAEKVEDDFRREVEDQDDDVRRAMQLIEEQEAKLR